MRGERLRAVQAVTAAPVPHRERRRWTAEEDRRLRALWEELPLDALAAELKRTPRATYNRAGDLGIARGCQPGHETLAAAARRAGFAPQTLRRILSAARVPFAEARTLLASPTRPQRLVEADAVDRAVVAWLSRETPKGAARRLGMSAERVESALAAAGHRRPRGRRKARWRLPSATIEAALAAYDRPGLSVSAHAARLKLHYRTLAKRLRAAGVLGKPQPGVEARLSVEVVDGVLARLPVARRRAA